MIGPILVAVNPYTDACNALTLTAARAHRPELARLVHDAVRHQADTGYPQAIILSGAHHHRHACSVWVSCAWDLNIFKPHET